MLAFKDFGPRQRSSPGFLRPAEYTDLASALDEINAWIAAEGIDLLHVETVVLPNLHSPHEQGSQDPELIASGDSRTPWHQFFRVWYRVAKPGSQRSSR